jgi:hypothetical protein
MKKLFGVISLVFFFSIMTGCSNENSEEPNQNASPTNRSSYSYKSNNQLLDDLSQSIKDVFE